MSFTIGRTLYIAAENNPVILPKTTVAGYNICFILINAIFHLNLQYRFYTNKCYISFELTCFGVQN
jgi:hypothetical protein